VLGDPPRHHLTAKSKFKFKFRSVKTTDTQALVSNSSEIEKAVE
jgi:hypothetical protein